MTQAQNHTIPLSISLHSLPPPPLLISPPQTSSLPAKVVRLAAQLPTAALLTALAPVRERAIGLVRPWQELEDDVVRDVVSGAAEKVLDILED